MEVVADSHVLFWWLSEGLHSKLSPPARKALEEASRVTVSAISLLEVLSLYERYRQPEKFPLLVSRLVIPRYHVLPVSLAIVRRCARLPDSLELHDRIIVATTQERGAQLVSKDRAIRAVLPTTIW